MSRFFHSSGRPSAVTRPDTTAVVQAVAGPVITGANTPAAASGPRREFSAGASAWAYRAAEEGGAMPKRHVVQLTDDQRADLEGRFCGRMTLRERNRVQVLL